MNSKLDFCFRYTKNCGLFDLCLCLLLSLLIFFPFCINREAGFWLGGDQINQCFGIFIEIGRRVSELRLYGTDFTTFNGATELFHRANMPVFYIPVYLISGLGTLLEINPALSYVFYHIVHTFVAFYFIFLIGRRFFYLQTRGIFIVIALTTIALTQSIWYSTFFTAFCLFFPCLYSAFNSLEQKSIKVSTILVESIPFFLIITSGHTVLGTFSIIVISSFVILRTTFSLKSSGLMTFKNIIRLNIKALSPIILAGLVSLPYLLNVLAYITLYVQNTGNPVDVYLKAGIPIFNSLSLTFFGITLTPTENMRLGHLGALTITWMFVSLTIIKFNKLDFKERLLIIFSFTLCFLIYSTEFGVKNPLTLLFYYLVPVYGQMHLTSRYLYFVLPLVYFSIALLITKAEHSDVSNKSLFVPVLLVNVLLITILLTASYLDFQIDKELLFFEIICQICFSFLLLNYGFTKLLYCIFVFCLISCSTSYLYINLGRFTRLNNSDTTVLQIKNKQALKKLDKFISDLDKEKEIFRYQFIRSKLNPVDHFFNDNLSWYKPLSYKITSYYGYEPHTSLPKNYLRSYWWFNQANYKYMKETGCDFVIVDSKFISEKQRTLVAYLDFDSKKQLVRDYYAVPFKQNNVRFDNGYFRSDQFDKTNVREFYTDDSSYIKLVLNVSTPVVLQYSFYPQRMIDFFVNGKKVQPRVVMVDGLPLVYIDLPTGDNLVEVRYDSYLDRLGILIVLIYIVCCLIFISKEMLMNRNFKSY